MRCRGCVDVVMEGDLSSLTSYYLFQYSSC